MHKRYENLEHAMCRELEKLDKKYSGDTEMTEQDAERARVLFHALKCAETYHAMVEAKEEGPGMSEARYSRPYMSRYSRDYYPEPGYSRGRPMEYIDPYWDRR